MYPRFQTTSRGTSAYIQKSVRVDGRTKTITVKCLGLLSDIQKENGCEDPRQWVIRLAERMTLEERLSKQKLTVSLSPGKPVSKDSRPFRYCGDLMLLPLYRGLGLPGICKDIQDRSRVKYNLGEIVKTLVMGRILFPCSKISTAEYAKSFVLPPKFAEHDMYRSLSLLCESINDIQAQVYRNSLSLMPRRDKVIFYDCTNFYFEIESDDVDMIDMATGEFTEGLRKHGKSKENRPKPVMQLGMFMDYDGIPLAFCAFPGNTSEQVSLQPLEEVLQSKFGLTQFVVSTDAGLGSEDNRLYNMEGDREYITVQSLKKLKEKDIRMALDPQGWRMAFRGRADKREALDPDDPHREIFNLDELRAQERAAENMKDTTLYKEILVEREHKDKKGVITRRAERVIVTYNNDYALYLEAKRKEQIEKANKIIKHKTAKPRQSQQDARRFIEVSHIAPNGDVAVKTLMSLNREQEATEARFDGFYAYGTSLDDNAIDILRIRSSHHEIEHLFRTTKSFLEARPVYLSRNDRIKSHFLICFLAMVMLKMLQRQLTQNNKEYYSDKTLSIDELIKTLRALNVGQITGYGYMPMFTRTQLTDQLQALANVNINTEIIPTRRMTGYYRKH